MSSMSCLNTAESFGLLVVVVLSFLFREFGVGKGVTHSAKTAFGQGQVKKQDREREEQLTPVVNRKKHQKRARTAAASDFVHFHLFSRREKKDLPKPLPLADRL